MTVRIGLLGCGRIAMHHHAPNLATIDHARVSAAIDPDPRARRRITLLHPGATEYLDLAKSLEFGDLDALVICTPPALHAEAAVTALTCGLHVYIEKPLSTTLEDADRIIEAAATANKVAMVGHNFRMHPKFRAAREALAAGALGELIGIRGMFTSERRALPGWKQAPAGGGDAITDLAIHHFDVISFITNSEFDQNRMCAEFVSTDTGSYANISGTLNSGQPVSMTVGQLTGQNTHRLELLCEKGHLEIDLLQNGSNVLSRTAHTMSLKERLGERLTRVRSAVDIRYKPDPSFRAAMQSFVDACAANTAETTNEIPLDAGRAALANCLAAMHAASRSV